MVCFDVHPDTCRLFACRSVCDIHTDTVPANRNPDPDSYANPYPAAIGHAYS